LGDPIDVVVPAHHKDFDTLSHCVRSVARHVDGVRRICVVADQRFESRAGPVEWVPEPASSVLPDIASIRSQWEREAPANAGRAPWVYQQLLKLGAREYVDGLSPRYLVVDSDVVFLRAVSFEGPRFPYSRSTELNPPYAESYRRLIGEDQPGDQSYTAHHMLYDQELLSEMFGQIESLHGNAWAQAYVDAVDFDEPNSINEQDTYAHWVISHHPAEAEHRQLRWRDSSFVPGLLARAVLSIDYDFVAAHAYRRESKVQRLKHVLAHVVGEVKAR
jgi:hypothetical protein